MKITYANNRYWPAMGGGENILRSVARGFCDKHQVQVVTILNNNKAPSVANMCVFAPNIASYSDEKAKILPLNPTPAERIKSLPSLIYYTPRFRRWFYEPLLGHSMKVFHKAYRNKLKKIIAGSDIVHSFTAYHLGHSCLHISRELKIPFVITPFVHPGQYGTEKINIDICKKADAVCALLKTEERFYINSGINPDRIYVVGSCPSIGKERFKEQIIKKYDLANKKIITYIGRKAAYKGILELQKAAELVFNRIPDTVLLLIGPQEKDCVIIKNKKILNLPTHIDIDYMTSFISLSDIICLPSRHEILPTVILEAWAFKKPVVASDIENIKCLVEDGKDGLLVKIEPESIADAIIMLLRDSGLREKLGQNGWQKLMSNYTKEKFLNKLNNLYDALIKGGNGKRHGV